MGTSGNDNAALHDRTICATPFHSVRQRRVRQVGWAVCLLALGIGSVASAAVCRVSTAGSSGNDGSDWTVPMDLQTALTTNGCSEVWVKTGTYRPTSGTDRTISFNILPGVAVYGGFAGSETQRSARNLAANPTTLSGDIGVAGNASDNSFHVLFLDGTTAAGIITATTVLDGFTISGGNADNSSGLPTGDTSGGLYCYGAYADHACSPTLSNLIFSGNSAQNIGGATGFFGYSGGASSPALSNVTFINNSAGNSGGAMLNYGYGGNSSPTLSNVTFTGNNAAYGGAMYNDGYAGTSSPTLSNVTFSGNTAQNGGAMFSEGANGGTSSPILSNVTFSGNDANNVGGALYNSATTLILHNIILWDNGANMGAQILNAGGTTTIDHSVVQGSGGSGAGWDANLGTDAGGNLDANPLLGALAGNGGATQTFLPGAGSSALNAGNDSVCAAAPVNGLDQRGVRRPQGIHCDIGAVEVVVDPIFANGFDLAPIP